MLGVELGPSRFRRASDIAVPADLAAQALASWPRHRGNVRRERHGDGDGFAPGTHARFPRRGVDLGAWSSAVQNLARTSAAGTAAESAGIVRENLKAQSAAASGVSLDEEAVNLLERPAGLPGPARLYLIVDELDADLDEPGASTRLLTPTPDS